MTSDAPIDTPYFISSFGEHYQGGVYVSDLTGGKVYRILGPQSVGGIAELPDLAAVHSAGRASGAFEFVAAALALG